MCVCVWGGGWREAERKRRCVRETEDRVKREEGKYRKWRRRE